MKTVPNNVEVKLTIESFQAPHSSGDTESSSAFKQMNQINSSMSHS